MTARFSLFALLLLLAGTFGQAALAVQPDEILDDPVLEQRARLLSKEIRCLVCQNEAIDSSNAELARDLRILVRERLVAGDSDQEVMDYLVARYGDFVLLRPPLKPQTYLIWFGPGLVLLLGALAVFGYFRYRATQPEDAPVQALSESERKQLQALLKEEGGR